MEFNKFTKEVNLLIETQINSIQKLKEKPKKELFELFNLIINTKNKIIFTGVGKSGHIAKKASASYASTGTSAVYLNPLDAAHGDLGIVNKEDIVIMISHSGNTQELIELIPSIKKIGAKIISITSNSSSKLAKESQIHIETYVNGELCHLNLAPTNSTTITLIILDVLMVMISKHKQFEKENFALYHPAGSLGKKLLLKVENVTQNINCSLEILDSSIIELIDIMTKIGKGLVPITENQKVVGVVTDGDIRRLMEKYKEKIFEIKVKEIIHSNFYHISPETLATEALKIMESKKITALPVIDKEKKFIGIINIHDLLKEGL